MRKYNNICDMIDKIKKNKDVIGILECGGRSHLNENIEDGDYDFAIITRKKISDSIIGIHFFVNEIPIDCALLTLDFFEKERPSSFDLMYVNSKILFDRDGTISQCINNINKNWNVNRKFSTMDISKTRYILSHRLNKVEHRLNNTIFSSFIIYQTISLVINAYGEINNLPIGKERVFLKHMENNASFLYKLIEDCYLEKTIEKKFKYLQRICEELTKDFGGLWKKEEIIFRNLSDFTVQEEVDEIYKIIF